MSNKTNNGGAIMKVLIGLVVSVFMLVLVTPAEEIERDSYAPRTKTCRYDPVSDKLWACK